jgi:hypothetical protein
MRSNRRAGRREPAVWAAFGAIERIRRLRFRGRHGSAKIVVSSSSHARAAAAQAVEAPKESGEGRQRRCAFALLDALEQH